MTVRFRDVTPRDGLQDQKREWTLEEKVELIQRLWEAGCSWIEATSFVNPRVVPQLADAAELCAIVVPQRPPGTMLSAFAATPRGAASAIEAGVDEISTAVPATDGMSQANFRRSTDQMLDELAAIRALAPELPMSATIAVAFGCPFDGPVTPDRVVHLATQLVSAGYDTIMLGDTVGVGSPRLVAATVLALRAELPQQIELGLHMHDPRGSAVANVVAGVQAGASIVDGAVGGLGGCPFAPGAAGNVASEDVAWVLGEADDDYLGPAAGALVPVARWIRDDLGVPVRSNMVSVEPFAWELA